MVPADPFINFNKRQVVVTGATSGIGEAIAAALCRCNAKVVLIGRHPQKLARTAEKLPQDMRDTLLIDLSDIESISPKIREFSKQSGPVYGLCHAAGVVETRPLGAFQKTSFQNMMDVNCTSGVELARAVCRRDVMTAEEGAVLFISSVYSLVGMPGQIGYSATKGAVNAAVRAMAVELARRNIRVNTISPGLVHTPMTDEALAKLPKEHAEQLEKAHPLGAGTPEDVARATVFLMAPENKWITGINLVVDGGYSAV
jgi:NAD(P)-dependent dehydrogenase (short-subunit alcohol dehydrogenase family)